MGVHREADHKNLKTNKIKKWKKLKKKLKLKTKFL